MRRFLVLCMIILSLQAVTTRQTMAADASAREIIGISPDGRYFAFEEYGIHDGSGFPFSNIFVIDTRTDRWVKGSPFRAFREQELANLENVRSETRRKFSAMKKRLNISRRLQHLYTEQWVRPELSINNQESRAYVTLPVFGRTHLTLTQFPLGAAQCQAYAPDTKGMTLTMSDEAGTWTKTIARDSKLPKSRGCALGYSFADIYMHTRGNQKPPVLIALINVFSFGFEGKDRRFLAIAKDLAR